MKGLVYREWEEYSRDVVPDDAPPEQEMALRLAFYSGAWSLCNLLLTRMGAGGPATTEETDLAGSILTELQGFRAELGDCDS